MALTLSSESKLYTLLKSKIFEVLAVVENLSGPKDLKEHLGLK